MLLTCRKGQATDQSFLFSWKNSRERGIQSPKRLLVALRDLSIACHFCYLFIICLSVSLCVSVSLSLKMYLWCSWCIMYFTLACQVKATLGDSGLCSGALVTSFQRWSAALFCWFYFEQLRLTNHDNTQFFDIIIIKHIYILGSMCPQKNSLCSFRIHCWHGNHINLDACGPQRTAFALFVCTVGMAYLRQRSTSSSPQI